MSDNGRLSLLFLVNLLLYFVIGEVNFFLGGWSLHLHADVLLVLFFGLYLNRMAGLIFATLFGFLSDAVSPVPYGTYVIGYLLLWLFLIWGQRRIRRQHPVHVRTLAAVAQLMWILGLTLIFFSTTEAGGFSWQRWLLELLFSCAIVYAAAFPWCRFQKRLLYSMGWNIDAEISKT